MIFAPSRPSSARRRYPSLPRISQPRAAFGPAQILALAPTCWFRRGVGITQATGVSQWADQSGNGNHLAQSTGSLQPLLQANNGILFDGTDDTMSTSAFTAMTAATVYALVKQVSWTSNDYLWDGQTSAAMGMPQTTSSPNLRAQTGGTPFSGGVIAGPAIGAYGVVATVYNLGSSVQQVGATTQTGTLGAISITAFFLGSNGVASTVFSNIEVMEVIVFNSAHTADQRSNVIRYLSALGGVSF